MKKYLFLFLLYTASFSLAAQISATQSRLLDDLKILASVEFEGRRTGTEGAAKARNFLQKRFAEIGLKPAFGSSYEQKFEFKNRQSETLQGINMAGVIEGKNKNLWIVVCAHYDHLGKVGNDIFPGADDNASGVAALLALAERFAKEKPLHNILFLAPDAEEMGLKGSRYFVENLPFPIANLALNINMDMVSRSAKNELFAVGAYHTPLLRNILEKQAIKDFTLTFGHDEPKEQPGYDWSNASDHAPFHQKGIPFIYFGVDDHEDYHKPTDTFDRIQPEFFSAVVKGIGDSIQLLDKNLVPIYKQKKKR
ncbi:M20/M25/M40 family metallo-hydrolase [Rhodoflexus sp.]